jgi:RimJ/RimL family protein N-acetyltransferase
VSLPTSTRLKDGRWAIIRRAQPEDAEDWVANVNAVGAERVFIMTEVLPRSVEEVSKQFLEANPRLELWLAGEVEGTIAGGADFRRGFHSKNAHVAGLGVLIRKGYRGIGLGEALMHSGIEWAQGVGVKRLKLGVFETNDRAIALYRKLGFIEEGRLKGEVILDGNPVDEILMALIL